MKQKDIIEINGRKYALVPDSFGEGDECERCALNDICHEDQELICQKHFGKEIPNGKLFIEVDENTLTEEKAYDDYQERSVKSGDRADQLAWMFIAMAMGVLIAGHVYQSFLVCAALATIYMLLSTLQSVWQTFAIWLIKCRIKESDIVLDDYPNWVGFGAWIFYWLKMIAITSAVVYFVKVVFF